MYTISCIVVLVSACLSWCCSHICFCCACCVDCRVGGIYSSWITCGIIPNATAVDSMRCAMKSARCFCLSPCALMIMRATLSLMTSLASIMTNSSLLSSKWLPASWNYMASGLVFWTLGLWSWWLRTAVVLVEMPASNSVITLAKNIFPNHSFTFVYNIPNAILWFDDDSSISRYTRCSVFHKMLI